MEKNWFRVGRSIREEITSEGIGNETLKMTCGYVPDCRISRLFFPGVNYTFIFV
jgi:hypothetical protein